MVQPILSKVLNSDKIPVRFNVAVMIFTTCFISYMLRVNMSINILGMVQPSNVNGTVDIPDYGPRYNWSVGETSLLLGAYFWGYFITTLPGGLLSELFGGRRVVGYALGLSGVLTALTPLAADVSFWAVYVMRVCTGLLGGVFFPALHNLVSKWAPPDEKGKFVSALLGGALGTVFTWPLAGLLMESFGWVYAFYVPAAITMVAMLVWVYLVADSPSEHPRITEVERDYIAKSLGDTVSNKKAVAPYFKIATSLPFLALMLLHYGNLWGLYFLLTAAPKFMNEVLKFDLAKAGILASLPSLARLIFGFIFGSLGDEMRRRQIMSVTAMRKSFCLFSHIIPGLLLIAISYIGNRPYWCVAIITASLGMNGASTLTNLQNSQDLAPNFAGSLYSIINFVGTSTGFISPMVVGYFTQERNTIDEWYYIFIIGGVAYILPAILFIFLGTGKIQKWNELKVSPTA